MHHKIDWLSMLGIAVFANLPAHVSMALQFAFVAIAVAAGKAIATWWDMKRAEWFQRQQDLGKDDPKPPSEPPTGGALALVLALAFGPLAACGGRAVLVRFDLPDYGPCVGQGYESTFDGGQGYRVGAFQCARRFEPHGPTEADASAD